MPKEALLVKEADGSRYYTKALILDEPEALKPLISPIGWRVILSLAEGQKYPAQVARELQFYRQKVYYYFRKFLKAGLIAPSKETMKATKYYSILSHAFAIELPHRSKRMVGLRAMDEALIRFWDPFIKDGTFDATVVVGSPEPHGPLKTTARDGHYAVQLALFLGQFCELPKGFAVKLDVDVKTEKEERSNLILIGGPGTNLLTADINPYLPYRFNEKNYWAGLMDSKGNTYAGTSDGLVAKIKNPYDKSKRIMVLAGNRHIGTKAAVIAVTSFWRELLSGYEGEDEWARVIRGFDMDGDGKVDSIELIS